MTVVMQMAPVFFLIGLGYLLAHRAAFQDRFWADAERLTFYCLFPALLIYSIGGADLGDLAKMWPMATALIVATLLQAATAVRLRDVLAGSPFNLDGPGFCSVFQGITRPNTYIGLAVAFALYGEAGLALMAIDVLAIIPLVNILSVMVHQRWAHRSHLTTQPLSGLDVLIDSLKNPVVIACLTGALLNLSGIGLPPVIGPTLNILGKGALPVGLMAVGAGLQFSSLTKNPGLYAGIALAKLLALPTMTWMTGVALGLDGITLKVAVLFAALPVSATSYVMSRQMNGDAPMTASIITTTTLASLISLPLVIAIVS